MLESLFNSEYFDIFKSTYFEEHLRTAASQNVSMKSKQLKIVHNDFNLDFKLETWVFQHQYVRAKCLFHDRFNLEFVIT